MSRKKTKKKTVYVSAGTPAAAELEARLADHAPNPEYLAALAGALDLAKAARVFDLARAVANPQRGDFVSALLGHELAACHRLMMRFGAMADQFLSHTSATVDPDRRQVGRDAIGFAAISARLMARYQQGALALLELRADADDGVRKIIVDWGWDDRPKDDGTGGSGPGNDNDPTPAGPASGPPEASGAAASPPLRRGRLKNGNPSGDYLAAPRCGAKTRAGCACRQPAMKNGRCRLHGGKSTGARTDAGQRRARSARLVHGRRTAAVIGLRSAAAAVNRRLAWMTDVAHRRSAGHGVDRSDLIPPLGRGAPAAQSRALRSTVRTVAAPSVSEDRAWTPSRSAFARDRDATSEPAPPMTMKTSPIPPRMSDPNQSWKNVSMRASCGAAGS
jgi:hypothetical protein